MYLWCTSTVASCTLDAAPPVQTIHGRVSDGSHPRPVSKRVQATTRTGFQDKNKGEHNKMRTTYPVESLDPEFLWDESGYDEKSGPRNPRVSRTYRVKKLG